MNFLISDFDGVLPFVINDDHEDLINTNTTMNLTDENNPDPPHDHSPPLCSIEGMTTYFNSLQASNDDQREALSIIHDRINNYNDNIEQLIPPDFHDRSKNKTVVEMKRILMDRIPNAEDRQSNIGKTGLDKWLTASNAERVFMFFNKTALLRIGAAAPFNVRLNDGTYDKLIGDLVGLMSGSNVDHTTEQQNDGVPRSQPNTMNQEITKALL